MTTSAALTALLSTHLTMKIPKGNCREESAQTTPGTHWKTVHQQCSSKRNYQMNSMICLTSSGQVSLTLISLPSPMFISCNVGGFFQSSPFRNRPLLQFHRLSSTSLPTPVSFLFQSHLPPTAQSKLPAPGNTQLHTIIRWKIWDSSPAALANSLLRTSLLVGTMR